MSDDPSSNPPKRRYRGRRYNDEVPIDPTAAPRIRRRKSKSELLAEIEASAKAIAEQKKLKYSSSQRQEYALMLSKGLRKLLRVYRDSVPTMPSYFREFTPQKQKLVIGVVAVREYGQIKFLYDSDCETRSVDYFFKQFRQFRDGRSHDYALIAPTDHSIAVIDLVSEAVIATLDLGEYSNWDFYIPEIFSSLSEDNTGLYLPRVQEVLGALDDPIFESSEEFISWMEDETVEWHSIIARASALLANDGFISVLTNETGKLENILLRIDLSKISEGVLKLGEPDERIVLVPWAPLSRSLSYSHEVAGELVVLQEVKYTLKNLP